jgi:putative transposase
MDGKAAWHDNVERLWHSVKYEEVYLRAYDRSARRAPGSVGIWTPDHAYVNNLPQLAAT